MSPLKQIETISSRSTHTFTSTIEAAISVCDFLFVARRVVCQVADTHDADAESMERFSTSPI